MNRSRLLTSGLAAVALTAIPATLDFDAETATVRVIGNAACGQASSCAPLEDYVCSTYHSDWEDKVCYTGCAKVEPEG